MIQYVTHPKCPQKAARLINESSKVAGYKIRHQAIQETHPAALH
jgi:hypothetical protein